HLTVAPSHGAPADPPLIGWRGPAPRGAFTTPPRAQTALVSPPVRGKLRIAMTPDRIGRFPPLSGEATSMKDSTKRLERGAPIAPVFRATPPAVPEREWEADPPGLGDEAYIRRRKELFALCRKHRLERLGPPLIDYNAEETRIWREVSPKLDELHVKH